MTDELSEIKYVKLEVITEVNLVESLRWQDKKEWKDLQKQCRKCLRTTDTAILAIGSKSVEMTWKTLFATFNNVLARNQQNPLPETEDD